MEGKVFEDAEQHTSESEPDDSEKDEAVKEDSMDVDEVDDKKSRNDHIQAYKRLEDVPTTYEPPRIANVVATCDFKQPIQLAQVVRRLWNVSLTKGNAGLQWRIAPKTSATIYASGKVNMAGMKSREKADETLTVLCKTIRRFLPDVERPELRFSNFFADVDLGFYLSFDKLIKIKDEGILSIKLDREKLPFVIIKLKDPSVTVHVPHTGRINFKGAKSEKEIEDGMKYIFPILRRCFGTNLWEHTD